MKDRKLVIIIYSFLFLMIISALFFYIILPSTVSYSGSIYVKSNSETTIYIPVLLDEKGNTLKMYDSPKISGDAKTAIIDTEHGKALKISGSGIIGIKLTEKNIILEEGGQEIKKKLLDRVTISMSDLNRSSFFNDYAKDTYYTESIGGWVYSDSDNTAFTFSFNLYRGWDQLLSINTGGNPAVLPLIDLSKGWQTVKFEASTCAKIDCS
ncbi:MAG: hypothetical protein WA144_14700 [Candidatus Methanoperedens sp.]